ncbi:MAG TPA: hypothetical protein VN699_13235 [Pirellulales bacterium]|nr:hypothetical protein [Pirellulales bacterium]
MATMDAAVAGICETSGSCAAARPDWRRQPHTWFLVALTAANIALDGLAARFVLGAASSEAISIGVLLAQSFLMGLWMALGGLHAAARFAAVVAATVAGAAVLWLGLRRPVGDLRELIAFGGIIVLATHAVLLPLRAMFGYRIDFDPAYHPRSADKSMQLRLMHLIAFTTACALPCALVRVLNDADAALAIFAFGGVGLVGSLPIAWLAVAARRTWRFWLAALGMLSASLVVDLWALGTLLPGHAEAAPVYAGIAATVLANLGVLRLIFGLRLFSVLGPAPVAIGSRNGVALDPDLAFVVDAWPRLPNTLRGDLLLQVRSATAPSPE